MTNIKELEGRVPVDIRHDDVSLVFKLNEDEYYVFYHIQDCCEDVFVESVTGDPQSLVGNEILVAEERVTHPIQEGYDSQTWTFYTFRGIGGTVDVRWYGSSNGYYSESVDSSLFSKSKTTNDYYGGHEVKKLFQEDFGCE